MQLIIIHLVQDYQLLIKCIGIYIVYTLQYYCFLPIVIRCTFWGVELPYLLILPFNASCLYTVNVENSPRDLMPYPTYPILFNFSVLFNHSIKASICMYAYCFERNNNHKQIFSGINDS